MGKRRLFHEDWYFLELGVDSKIEDLWEKENAFKQVNLPHDWQIYHADELYRDGIGWYRKRFFCEKKPGKRKYVIIRICQQLYFSDTLFS